MIIFKQKEVQNNIGHMLPYSHYISPTQLMCKSGQLVSTLAIKGLACDTATDSDIAKTHTAILNAIKILPDNTVVHVSHVRRVINEERPPKINSEFAQKFAKDYYTIINDGANFTTDIYLSVILNEKLPRWGRGAKQKPNQLKKQLLYWQQQQTQKLNQATMQLVTLLQEYSPTICGVNGKRHSQLQYLGYLINSDSEDYVLPNCNVSDILASKQILFKKRYIELTGNAGRQQYIAMLSLKHYGRETAPNLLAPLLKLPINMVVHNIFAPIDKEESKSLITRQQNNLFQVNDAARGQVAELEEAMEDLQSEEVTFGWHTCFISITAESVEELNRDIIHATKELFSVGLKPVTETLNLEACFWSQFPGNFEYINRKALIHSGNFADFIGLQESESGHKGQNHLGSAVMPLKTPFNNLYHFNFHKTGGKDERVLGHTTIIGPSGSGKTTFLAATDCMRRQFGGKSFILDYRMGMAGYVKSLKGQYFTLEEGKPTGINPIPAKDTSKARGFLQHFLVALVLRCDEKCDCDDDKQITKAIDGIYSLSVEDRSLRNLIDFFDINWPKRARLETWLQQHEGSRAYLFDNQSHEFSFDNDVIGLDLSFVMQDDVALLPFLLYLFYQIELALDGKLCSIILDEGWQFLRHPYWQTQLNSWLATLRKENAYVVFATQNPREVSESPLSYGLIQNAATNIYFPNMDATFEDYCDKFNLNEREFEMIKSIPTATRSFLVKQGSKSTIATLDLGLMQEYVKRFSDSRQDYA